MVKKKQKGKNPALFIVPLILILLTIVVLTNNPGKLDFSWSECRNYVGLHEGIGVKEVKWIDEKTVEIKTNISINCAEEIKRGSHHIIGNDLVLTYTISGNLFTVASCNCIHELTYRISDIEKRNYEVKLQKKRVLF